MKPELSHSSNYRWCLLCGCLNTEYQSVTQEHPAEQLCKAHYSHVPLAAGDTNADKNQTVGTSVDIQQIYLLSPAAKTEWFACRDAEHMHVYFRPSQQTQAPLQFLRWSVRRNQGNNSGENFCSNAEKMRETEVSHIHSSH